jgi:hypothetical protein
MNMVVMMMVMMIMTIVMMMMTIIMIISFRGPKSIVDVTHFERCMPLTWKSPLLAAPCSLRPSVSFYFVNRAANWWYITKGACQ